MAGDKDDGPFDLAALDLGSNSFHLIVARFDGGRLQIIDRHKEMVRLSAGIDASGSLTEAAMARALECLARTGERLRSIAPERVRAVGTNTLRKASNAREFVSRAEAALGHRIEIISGREEARLIYAGVCHALAPSAERRLLIDIGGGSTEVILGRGHKPLVMESLYMGCVSFSERFFPDGRIRARVFDDAVLAARQEFEPIEVDLTRRGWDTVVGASGTLLAVRDVLAAMEPSDGSIRREAMTRLVRALIDQGDSHKLSIAGLSNDRAPVFVGGVAILTAFLEGFGIERMRVSDGALREGLLVDLLGRVQRRDLRESTIVDLMRRYHVDVQHAQRVKATALGLLKGVAADWHLDDPEWARLLGWAALVHEIGMDISHSQYHKHGYYLIEHMDLPGFSQDDQRRLALLVRSHRRKFPKTELAALDADEADPIVRLAALLRLAVVLQRNRTAERPSRLKAAATPDGIELSFAKGWLAERPLTRLDLTQERDFLASIPLQLDVNGLDANGRKVDG